MKNWFKIAQNNEKFNNLIIVKYIGKGSISSHYPNQHMYICKCMCGKSNVAATYEDLTSGKIKSCGCLNNKYKLLHGLSKEKYYKRWIGMNLRCSNTNDRDYKHYGDRGIYVSNCWKYYPNDINKVEINRNNYKNFEKWFDYELKNLGISYNQSIQLGYSIDRIDNSGPYSPMNCRLVSKIEQSYNRRSTRNFNKKILFDLINKFHFIFYNKNYILKKEWKINKKNKSVYNNYYICKKV